MDDPVPERVLFEGRSLRLRALEGGIAELCFSRDDASANKLDRRTLAELELAIGHLRGLPGLRGVLVTSAKDEFMVGADITEFVERFSMPEEAITRDVRAAGDCFLALEDLPVPTVATIDGYALGGGLELALACSMRVMSFRARIGLPEVKLGLIPGAGGNVRLPRVAGTSAAIEWITTGSFHDAQAALAVRAVDEICKPEEVRATAMRVLLDAVEGTIDWRGRRVVKCAPVAVPAAGRQRLYQQARQAIGAQPCAALTAIELMEHCDPLEREAALGAELRVFARIVTTPEAARLVQAFLDGQRARRQARQEHLPASVS